MYNKELYNWLEQKYGREQMVPFCDIVSDMYKILEDDRVTNCIGTVEVEYGYEAQWWGERYEDLLYDRDLIDKDE